MPSRSSCPTDETCPGSRCRHRYTPGYISGILLTEAAADELGLEVAPLASLFTTPEPLTGAERDDLEDLQVDLIDDAAALDPTDVYRSISLQWSSPSSGPSPFQLELILTGVALRLLPLRRRREPGAGGRGVEGRARHPHHRGRAARACWPGRPARAPGCMAVHRRRPWRCRSGSCPWSCSRWAQAHDRRAAWSTTPSRSCSPPAPCCSSSSPSRSRCALVAWVGSGTAQRLRPVRVSTATFE